MFEYLLPLYGHMAAKTNKSNAQREMKRAY